MSARPSKSGTGRSFISLSKTRSSKPSQEVIGYVPRQMATPATRSRMSSTRPSVTGSKSATTELPTRSNNTHWQTKMALASTVAPTMSGSKTAPGSARTSSYKMSPTCSVSSLKTKSESEFKTYVAKSISTTGKSGVTSVSRSTRPSINTKPGMTKNWAPVSRTSNVTITGAGASSRTRDSTSIMVQEEIVEEKKSDCCPCWVWILLILLGIAAIILTIWACTRNGSDKNKNETEDLSNTGLGQVKPHDPPTLPNPNVDLDKQRRDEEARKHREEEEKRRRKQEADARRRKQEDDARRRKQEEDARKQAEAQRHGDRRKARLDHAFALGHTKRIRNEKKRVIPVVRHHKNGYSITHGGDLRGLQVNADGTASADFSKY